jgi:anti-sigma-K factor RskA
MSSDSDRYGRAGDYVMGRMEPAERERAERDLERDPQFREAVLRLSERIRRSDVVADKELWRAVEAGLGDLPQMRTAIAATPSSLAKTRRRTDSSVAPSQPQTGWKGALLVAGLALACGASYVAGDIRARPGTPDFVVALIDQDGGVGGILEIGDDDMMRFVPLTLAATSDGEAAQLFTIYDDAIGFVPLGTLLAGGATRWRGPDLPPPKAGQRYGVAAGDGTASAREELFIYRGTALPVAGRR